MATHNDGWSHSYRAKGRSKDVHRLIGDDRHVLVGVVLLIHITQHPANVVRTRWHIGRNGKRGILNRVLIGADVPEVVGADVVAGGDVVWVVRQINVGPSVPGVGVSCVE